MIWSARAFLGALLGSLITLLVHPLSRPYLLGGLHQLGPCQALHQTPELLANRSLPTEILSAIDGSLWMEAGSARLAKREVLKASDLEKLVEVAKAMERLDPKNAYWSQMLAVWDWQLGRPSESRIAWLHAGTCSLWNDYQSTRLVEARKEVSFTEGVEQSWHYAALYPLRSTYPADLIFSYAKVLERSLDKASHETLNLRFATLMNGKLMREGSRNLLIGITGAQLVELATYPNGTDASPNPKKLVIARQEMISQLKSSNMVLESEQANKAFLANEGWLGLIDSRDPNDEYTRSAYRSVLAASLAGSLLITGALGWLIYGFGMLLNKFPKLQVVLQYPVVPFLGTLLAIGAYLLTRLILTALSVAAAFTFLTISPARFRSNPPKDFGPFFQFTLIFLGLVFMAFASIFWIGLTTPAIEVLPHVGIPHEYYNGSTLFLGLAGITGILLLLVAPSWATVQRISTVTVAIQGIKMFGRGLGITSLLLAVLCTPIAIYFDRTNIGLLSKLMSNEPVYYLSEQTHG